MAEYVAYAVSKKRFHIEKDGTLLVEYLKREEIRGWLCQTLEPGDDFTWDNEILKLPPEAGKKFKQESEINAC